MTEVRQAQGITVACEDRIQDGQPTGTRDVPPEPLVMPTSSTGSQQTSEGQTSVDL